MVDSRKGLLEPACVLGHIMRARHAGSGGEILSTKPELEGGLAWVSKQPRGKFVIDGSVANQLMERIA